MRAYRGTLINLWETAIEERLATNEDKTVLIHRAQQILALGIAFATITLVLLGFAVAQNAIP